MKLLLLVSAVLLGAVVAACANSAPTSAPTTAPQATAIVIPTPIELPTFTPAPLNDPDLLQLKQKLQDGLDKQDGNELMETISFGRWVASIYRQGGTPPIDPPRGLNLTLEFAKENKLEVDLERPTYEPRWSMPGGDTSILVRATPPTGDPYYAHFYITHEAAAWRYTGILTRIPYYDAPSVAQLQANPKQYDGKEFMYVGAYQRKTNPPQGAGDPPPDAAFVLDTWAGPIWVTMAKQPYTVSPPADANSRAGQNVRLFGTIKLNNGVPYIESDSVQFIEPKDYAHTKGTVKSVDAATRNITIQPEGNGASQLHLTVTTPVWQPDGTRGTLSSIQVGQTVDAIGVPQQDGTLLVEGLWIAK